MEIVAKGTDMARAIAREIVAPGNLQSIGRIKGSPMENNMCKLDPIGSIERLIFMVNVGKYTTHGSYGDDYLAQKSCYSGWDFTNGDMDMIGGWWWLVDVYFMSLPWIFDDFNRFYMGFTVVLLNGHAACLPLPQDTK